jgi:hypothetical protein
MGFRPLYFPSNFAFATPSRWQFQKQSALERGDRAEQW